MTMRFKFCAFCTLQKNLRFLKVDFIYIIAKNRKSIYYIKLARLQILKADSNSYLFYFEEQIIAARTILFKNDSYSLISKERKMKTNACKIHQDRIYLTKIQKVPALSRNRRS